jgi:hypothetical protein
MLVKPLKITIKEALQMAQQILIKAEMDKRETKDGNK